MKSIVRLHLLMSARFAMVLLALMTPCLSTAGGSIVVASSTPSSSTIVWTDFRTWTASGVSIDGTGHAMLCSRALSCVRSVRHGHDPFPGGGYHGHNFYNGGQFHYGRLTSPVVRTPDGFTQAVASWNAVTPSGTWVEIRLCAHIDGHWTGWYSMGVWASGTGTVNRHSVGDGSHGDANGAVDTDTLKLKRLAGAVQMRIMLFADRPIVSPNVELAAVTASGDPAASTEVRDGESSVWGHVLPVPLLSQRAYRTGDGWCGPASVAMVMDYWAGRPGADRRRLERSVPAVAAGTYDWRYDGYGNWPFNTAYAGTSGLRAYVTRLPSLAALERWIAQGVPVVLSIAWHAGGLDGAPWSASDGHLLVVVGFDRHGNPVVNDPGGFGAGVRRSYRRAQLERAWLTSSAGTAYLIMSSFRSSLRYTVGGRLAR